LSEAPADLWRRLMNVNVVAASLCAQISVKMMMEKGNVVKTKFSGKKTFESYIGDYWEAKTALT
jgi:hypothetical protein